MREKIDVTESMIIAARGAGNTVQAWGAGVRNEDIRRVLSAGLSKLGGLERGAKYDLWISNTIQKKKARFLGVTERFGYYRVETEDGQQLVVHANEIQPSRAVL